MTRTAALHPSSVKTVESATTMGAAKGVPPRRRSLALCAAAAALIALVIVGYGGLWTFTSLNLRSGVLNWIAARQAEGYRIAYTDLDLGGFPLAARVTVLSPVVTAPDGRTLGWSWAGDRAAIEASPFRYDGITLRLAGEEALSVNVGGKLKTYRGGAEEMTLRTAGGTTPASGELTVRGLAMAAEEPGDIIGLERLTATGALREQVPAVSGSEPILALHIDAAGLRLPQQWNLPLGDTIEDFSANATVHGLLRSFTDIRASLDRWREGGGMVDVAHLGVKYGPLSMTGSGTLSVDEAVQPVGAFTTRVQGFQQSIAALTDRGIIDPGVASKARMALAILSGRAADGGPPVLQVPLTVRESTLSVGPLPLLVVPVIEWPRGPNPSNGGLPAAAMTAPG